MTKTEKTFSVKYVGNADKNNQSASIVRKNGAVIAMGGPAGELTEPEIARLRTSGLQLEVGREIKAAPGDDPSTGNSTKTSG